MVNFDLAVAGEEAVGVGFAMRFGFVGGFVGGGFVGFFVDGFLI